MQIETKCRHEGYKPENGGPGVMPIVQSTTYRFDSTEKIASLFDMPTECIYSRFANPTCDAVEKKIAALEGGVGAMLTTSGQAASLLSILNLCSAGDSFIAVSTIYGGTINLFGVTLKKLGIECIWADAEADEEEIQKLFKPNTKAVFGETLANPALTVFDIEKWANIAHKNNVPLIVDNTFATPVLCRPFEWGADIAGHKFRGPRGTGVLYVKNGIQLEPLVYGGGQERGLVSGTENTAGFIGLAAAMQDACEHLDEKMGYVKKLTDKLVKGIMENIPYSHYTGDPVNRLPGTASFVFEAIEGEGLILRLDNAGVCGSTGSACSTGSLDPSHVLMAIGLPHEIAHGSLRLTLGEQNTEEDVDYVIETVTDVVKTLRSMSPVWENGKPNLSAAADLTAHH